MTQFEAVINCMIDNGGITSKEANDKLGVTRLSHYIYLLRRDGNYIVSDEIETGMNRYGNPSRWKRYRLKERKK